MKDRFEENPPLVVPCAASPSGTVRDRWPFAVPSVWTERMLTALEQGVKGGRWFSLMDKVWAPANLHAAWLRVKANRGAAGCDGQRVEDFDAQADASLRWLHEQLRTGQYRPQPVRRVWIPKASGKPRPLGIPTVRDRIVQAALKNVLEPIFERTFVATSFGFRPGRSAKDALREVDRHLREGVTHVVDADIEAFFDSVDHTVMRSALEEAICDEPVLSLVDLVLRQSVMEAMGTWTPTGGTPQGAVLSPLLANIYLHSLDAALRAQGLQAIRYADDLVLLCRSADEAARGKRVLEEHLGRLRLRLHPEKTRIVAVHDPGEGFDFLGYRFEQGHKRPRDASKQKLRDRVRALTPRNSGDSLDVVVKRLNTMLRGWFEYFQHSKRRVFAEVDGFVRRRLRAILQRRIGHRSYGFGAAGANVRWPNAFFAQHGLFSTTAHARARRSR